VKTSVSPGDLSSLRREFQAAGSGHEFRSRDGKRLLGVELHAQGIRDLHAAILRMAQQVSLDRRATRGIVAVWTPRVSDDRIRGEWGSTLSLFKPAIASRMALVVVRPDRCLTLGDDPELRRLGDALRADLGKQEAPVREARPALSRKFFEIFKILLGQWLLRKGPAAIGELMRRTGCSYPSVAEAIRRLEGAGEIARRSNRSVELAAFPRKTWSEALAMSETLRRTRSYADSSGRPADPAALLRRLQALAPPRVAIGGVQSAHRWDPHFDLHGLPRLDVTVHVARGVGDFGFVNALDPALQRAQGPAPKVVLAVHPLFRTEALFEKNPKGKLDWADPVETLLDLHELGLVDQAEAMIRRLGGRG
jgi:hypothetical protein